MHGEQAERKLPEESDQQPATTQPEPVESSHTSVQGSPENQAAPQSESAVVDDAALSVSEAENSAQSAQTAEKQSAVEPSPVQDASLPAATNEAEKENPTEPAKDEQITSNQPQTLQQAIHSSTAGSADQDVTTVNTRQLLYELQAERAMLPVFAGDTGNLQGVRFYIPDHREPLLVNRTLISIGRTDAGNNIHPTLDLTPYHGRELGVSRYHAEIVFSNDKYFIKDIGSTNGTWVNSRKIPPYQQIQLYSGDQVRFGHLMLVVRFLEK